MKLFQQQGSPAPGLRRHAAELNIVGVSTRSADRPTDWPTVAWWRPTAALPATPTAPSVATGHDPLRSVRRALVSTKSPKCRRAQATSSRNSKPSWPSSRVADGLRSLANWKQPSSSLARAKRWPPARCSALAMRIWLMITTLNSLSPLPTTCVCLEDFLTGKDLLFTRLRAGSMGDRVWDGNGVSLNRLDTAAWR